MTFDNLGIQPGGVLLVGEPMGLFTATEEGSCSEVSTFHASVAGAELNVAVGLQRLGQNARYMTKLGDDVFAERIRAFMQANDLDESLVAVDNTHATGFMMKSKVSHGDPKTHYFRAGSAASTIGPDDVRAIDVTGLSVLHMTGILPPLSKSTLNASYELISMARDNGMFVSFDPNLRPTLWGDLGTMCANLRELASMSDLVLPGISEGREMFGTTTVEDTARAFLDNGAKAVVVKNGSTGAYVADGTNSAYVPGYVVDRVVDTVGCGDGFAAGVLSALLEGQDLEQAAARGCAVGAIQTQSPSDNEGLPTPADLEAFVTSHRRADVPAHS